MEQQPPETQRRLERLRRGFLLGSVVAALLTVIGQSVIQTAVGDQSKSAEIVNIAGRQRMLSQRMTLDALAYARAAGPEQASSRLQDLGNALELWRTSQDRLVSGDLSAPSPNTAQTRAMFQELEPIRSTLEDRLVALGGHPPSEVPQELIAEILEAEERYLPVMNAIVFAYSAEAAERIHLIRRTQLALAATVLATLALQAALVFHPLISGLRESLRREAGAARALAESQERYARVIEAVDDGIWDWDAISGALYFSPRFRALAAIPEGAASSWEALKARVLTEDRPRLSAALSGNLPIDLELRLATAEGEPPRWLRLRGRIGGGGRGRHGSGTLADLTLQKLLEAEREALLRSREADLRESRADLQRLQLMDTVGQLAGGVAHSLNNHLQVILMNGELLAMRRGPHAPEIDAIRAAADDAVELSQQLLALSRDDQEVLTPTDLRALLEEMEPMVRSLLSESVRLDIALDPALPPVLADPGQIRQAVIHLCTNARDAMPGGGHLSIRAGEAPWFLEPSRPVRGVQILVQDDGQGMSRAVRERVFEPFFTTKPIGRGIGLGLTMVHRIVDRHRGSVGVDSVEGGGTTIRLWLPVAEAASAAPPELQTPLRILLVEDNEQVRSAITRLLRSRGHTVCAVGTFRDAIEVARDRVVPLDLVITDVVMPDISGPKLASQIRELREPDLPVLLISGYTAGEVGPTDTCTHFLRKPFDIATLTRSLHELLAKSALSRAAIAGTART